MEAFPLANLEYLHRAVKLANSPPSPQAIHVRYVERDEIINMTCLLA